METKKLRQKILDLAIHGKLVPQDPNDEPASVLLERIRAEKERLIKEGKIKRSKKSASDTPHYENVPFEVPEGWEWCKLDDLVCFQGGYAYKSSTYIDKSDWQIIRIGNVKNDELLLDNQPVYVSEEIGCDTQKYLIKAGDILFTMTGTKGKRDYFFSVVVPHVNHNLLLNQRVGCLRSLSKELNIDFLCLILKGQYVLDEIFATETGNVSQGNIGSESTLNLRIAVPPVAEQQRIIAVVKLWFTIVDVLEKETSDLSVSIQLAKTQILDLAIHGKLVPQDPNDEPAIELLKRINPKFTPCDNAHYPFEIPTTWCLTYVKDIVDNPSCKPFQILQSDINDIGQTPVVSQSSNYIEGYSDRKDCVFQNKNAVLIFGDHTRNLKYVDFDFIVGADGVKIIIPHISIKYSYYALQFIINGMRNRGYARHYSVLTNSIIPVPPLAEQLRIVAKIEELFAVLDEIHKSIEA